MNSLILYVCLGVLGGAIHVAIAKDAALETVSVHGQLAVDGTQLLDESGEPVQLKGMSLFGSTWTPRYYNKETVDGSQALCHSNVIRASLVVDGPGGYLTDPTVHMALIEAVVDAAIEDDMYVIVNWQDDKAENHLAQAKEFFGAISEKYGSYPNVIYEPYSEPQDISWPLVLKAYHEALIATIRANDPDNLILLGTAVWGQQVDAAAADPITDQVNIMYTLHFFAGTHKQWLRDTADAAIAKGLPIFVSSYSTVDATAVGPVDADEARLWWDWLDENNMSYVNYELSDTDDSTSALIPGTTPEQVCQEEFLTESGQLVVEQNKS